MKTYWNADQNPSRPESVDAYPAVAGLLAHDRALDAKIEDLNASIDATQDDKRRAAKAVKGDLMDIDAALKAATGSDFDVRIADLRRQIAALLQQKRIVQTKLHAARQVASQDFRAAWEPELHAALDAVAVAGDAFAQANARLHAVWQRVGYGADTPAPWPEFFPLLSKWAIWRDAYQQRRRAKAS